MNRSLLLTVGLAGLVFAQAEAQTRNQAPAQPPVSLSGPPTAAIPQVDSSAATVVSGQEVEPGWLTAIRDLSAQTPDFTVFDSDNERLPRFSLRGFRENNFGAGQPVAGLYVDDIPYFDLYSRGMELFDARDVQFVRGSQQTLYGASGIAGVMNVETAQPGNATSGYAEAGYGTYSYEDFRAGLGGPIITNQLFLSLDGLDSSRDGFVLNNTFGNHPDSLDALAIRGTLRWTPSAPWSIVLTGNAAHDSDGFVPTYLPGADAGPFSVYRNFDGDVHTDNVDEALKITYNSSSFRVTSVTTHRDWHQDSIQDYDLSAANLAEGFSSPSVAQWSEELRAQSPTDNGPLKWLAGLFFLSDDQRTDSGTTQFALPPPLTTLTVADSQYDTYAGFGQATATFFQQLDVTLGVRLTYEQSSISRVGTEGALSTGAYNLSQTFTSAQPRAALSWHFTPKLEVYASATEASQNGGFNPLANEPSLSSYSPDRSWEFEAGAKTSWMNGKLAVNAALFYTEADDYQTYRLDPTDPTQGFLLNAQRAALEGAELEATARPFRSLDLSGSFGYTHAVYERFTEPAAAGGLTLDGKPISFVPRFTANFLARYRLPWWHLYLSGSLIGVGRYELDDGDNITSGPTVQSFYALVNAKFGYQGKTFGIYFFANNIFDRRYWENARDLGYSSLVLEPGDPATFGVAARARF